MASKIFKMLVAMLVLSINDFADVVSNNVTGRNGKYLSKHRDDLVSYNYGNTCKLSNGWYLDAHGNNKTLLDRFIKFCICYAKHINL